MDKYVKTGQARFVYRHFAFLGEESFLAAQASECAGEQGKFWEYHDALFAAQKGENAGAFSAVNLTAMAARLGLGADAFSTCLTSGRYKATVDASNAYARLLKVRGTPTLFVIGPTGERIEVPDASNFEQVSKIVDAQLAR